MGERDFDTLPEWLKQAWKLAPEIARKAEAELSALRSRVAELEAAQAVVTPNNCRHCHNSAEKMREAAARCKCYACRYGVPLVSGRAFHADGSYCNSLDIRELPLPPCGDCNPLKP